MGLNKKYDPRHKPPIIEDYSSPILRFNFPGLSTIKGNLPTARHWNYHYFKNKSAEWWEQASRNNTKVIQIILPEAIDHIVRNNFLTSEEGDNIKKMIISSDTENFMVAIMVIIKYKKEIIKLKRHAKI